MEHGTVTTTNYENGVVYCDVQAIRMNTEYQNVPLLKPHSGFIQVPEQGETVIMHKLRDGTRFIGQVISREEENPDNLQEGDLAIQLDAETLLTFTKRGDGNIDVNIGSSGDVIINGTNFSEHTHEFKDSTIADTGDGTGTESTTTKETKKPK